MIELNIIQKEKIKNKVGKKFKKKKCNYTCPHFTVSPLPNLTNATTITNTTTTTTIIATQQKSTHPNTTLTLTSTLHNTFLYTFCPLS